MDFEFNGVKYFAHRYYKEWFGLANYVYFKDGDLVFVDFINEDVKRQLKSLKYFQTTRNSGFFIKKC